MLPEQARVRLSWRQRSSEAEVRGSLEVAGAASLRLDELVREVRKLLAEVRRLGLGLGLGLHRVNL